MNRILSESPDSSFDSLHSHRIRDSSPSTSPVMATRTNSRPSWRAVLCNTQTLDKQSVDADCSPIDVDSRDNASSMCHEDDSTETFPSLSSVYRSSKYYTPRRSSLRSSSRLSDHSAQSSNFCFGFGKVQPTGVGAGLSNLGYTCFMNAVLQCVTHTVVFVKGLRSFNHLTPCNCSTDEFCAMCAIREHIELSLSSSGRVISPTKFANNFNYISSSFMRFQQEDAHEFLQCLLDKLERSCLDSTSNDMTFSNPNNLVKQVFGGRLISELKCCNCGHCSITPFIDLSLEIEDVETLPSALESFTKVEKITKFICNNCKKEVSLEKQLMLEQAPSVAAFHLKRFKADGGLVEKIDKHVGFPLELELSQYTSGSHMNNVTLTYNLYAIVVHSGIESTSGHYYSFIRSSPHIWHKLNDKEVTRVEEESVLSQEAYILFYARQGTPWFSTLIEEKKSCLNIKKASPDSILDKTQFVSHPTITNIHSCPVNESIEAAEQVFSCDTTISEVQANLTRDAARSKQDMVVLDESRNGSSVTQNICSTSSSDIKDSNKIFEDASTDEFLRGLTPPNLSRNATEGITKQDMVVLDTNGSSMTENICIRNNVDILRTSHNIMIY